MNVWCAYESASASSIIHASSSCFIHRLVAHRISRVAKYHCVGRVVTELTRLLTSVTYSSFIHL
jgi:hypothetical protein